jgi:hypothetical protein
MRRDPASMKPTCGLCAFPRFKRGDLYPIGYVAVRLAPPVPKLEASIRTGPNFKPPEAALGLFKTQPEEIGPSRPQVSGLRACQWGIDTK